MSFKEVKSNQNFPELEQEILKFWREQNIFQKSLNKNKGQEKFVFYEGPPTANGRPGIHHVLARAFKDIICRYQTMKGKFVARRAGWDTHGLPVEIEVEKQLGLKNKKDIEKFGIAEFNKKCRESVWTYKEDWEKLTERIGFWIDLKNPYITYENEYIEKVWGVLKQIWDKNLLYEGYKVVPYCPRCGTTLASHEVAQGYRNIEEPSVYVKFPIKNRKNTFFPVWTTTPWTLPGNAALAVGEDFDYIEADVNGETLIIADKCGKIILSDCKIVKRLKGKDLVGLSYEPLYPHPDAQPNDYKVWGADFVSTDEGTGIVHIAPAFGIDDKNLRDKHKFSIFVTVDEAGLMTSEIAKDKFVKLADEEIKDDLKARGLFFKEEKIKHEYPFCWRCEGILIYLARSSWFIDMSKVRRDLIKNNEDINWVPAYIKQGRFGEWLREVKDWALSRERFWGTPLPIWVCECGEKQIIGSIAELKEKAIDKVADDIDLHRPGIDQIKIKCSCGEKATRVPELIDAWFDSGSMPFASGEFPENFPADYISEGIDQTRGWFYTLLAISTLLEKGTSYKNVICLGHVLDENGKKMSKSKGNVIVPEEIINQCGSDSVRWFFYTVNSSCEPKRMSARDVEVTLRRFTMTLWNVYSFFVTYANIDGFQPQTQNSNVKCQNILDRWIISKLNELIVTVTKNLDEYNVTNAARAIEEFTIDLSTWYLRRSRKRRDPEFYATLYQTLISLVKLLAPFAPFVAEEIYQNLKTSDDLESVHLCDFPKVNDTDQTLLESMAQVRNLVETAHAKRAEAKVRLRQPLASATIKIEIEKDLQEILKDEINVKEIKINKGIESDIELDTKLTPVLQEEGELRDLLRQVQDLRKKAGLNPADKVELFYSPQNLAAKIIEKFGDRIKTETNVSAISKSESENEKPLWLGRRPDAVRRTELCPEKGSAPEGEK